MAPRKFALLILTTALASCQFVSTSAGMPPTGSGTVGGTSGAVSISGFAFQPASLSIARGVTLTWTNSDAVAHTVTSTDLTPAFDSGSVGPGGSFSFTFSTAGSFPYKCGIHPSMTGTITVMP
jgi:plastocyanin